MTTKQIDVVAFGTCYVDTNVDNFPFDRKSIIGEEHIGEGYEVVPGGSAVNFCRLVQLLGLRTAFIGMVGEDSNGDTLERLLVKQGVTAELIRQADLLTNIGFNITNPQGEHVMFVAGTANAALSPEAVLPRLAEVLPQARMVYVGGCLKLKTFRAAFAEMTAMARAHNVLMVVDHGRVPTGVSAEMVEAVKGLVLKAQYYFPSREEFCELWNVKTIEEGFAALEQAAPELTTIVKDGENGAYYWEEGSMQHMPAQKLTAVVNATGAGDSFNAAVMTALLTQRSLADAVSYGCAVAAAKISAQDLPTL